MKTTALIRTMTIAMLLLLSSLYAQEPPATATVHVYRPKHFVGSALSPSIYYDGIELKRLPNGTFFVASVPSGKHMITAGRSEVGLLIEFQPGKHYFFEFGHRNWVGTAVSGRQPAFLSQVSAEEAEVGIRRLKQR